MSLDQLLFLVVILKVGGPILYQIARMCEAAQTPCRQGGTYFDSPFRTRNPRQQDSPEARRQRPHAEDEKARRATQEADEARRMAISARRRDEREADRLARRMRRDAYYRARGIEPGAWAWFQTIPEVWQAILMGLAFSVPLVVVVVAVFRAAAPGVGR